MNYLLKAYVRMREEAGQSMTEYALIMAAIAVVAMAAYSSLGSNVSTLVNNVTNKL
ncbi:MAG TPA: Flp family type IVb pilin [Candidatus Binataceae bacterium]|nr:Flp family type IVb pilin [Candidatus Binataceae bacterium]